MIKITAPPRGQDSFGSGAFHASRGSRNHQGRDYLAAAGSKVHAVRSGIVTRLGYTYKDNLSYRYVEIKDVNGHFLRYYYVKPSVEEGDEINTDDVIGFVQNLDLRYKGMPNHIHFEIKDKNYSLVRIDPEEYLKNVQG